MSEPGAKRVDKPFFFFSVPRPLALVLDFALALGILLVDLVTLEVDLDLVAGLVVFCAVVGLAIVQQETQKIRRLLGVYEVEEG